jgi:site-specific DNA-methyltransferase (cytosine-N4-specific)
VCSSAQIGHSLASSGTRLSRLHPYPAMVADDLAVSLASRFVPSGAKMLDPFCGSGRLLAAASTASLRMGIDANPLAWLLTRAKFARPQPRNIRLIIDEMELAKKRVPGPGLLVDRGRKVAWFSKSVLEELCRIVNWLNSLELSKDELFLVASALSATVRDVSFARDQGWKLHRLDAETRRKFRPCPWIRFKTRLGYCLEEISTKTVRPSGRTIVKLGDSRSFFGEAAPKSELFDVVLTSPPYGDSRSTVQYGAASALCLSIVSSLRGLSHLNMSGGSIDGICLGGTTASQVSDFSLKPYWSGSARSPFAVSVSKFLSDYDAVCSALAKHLKPGGKAVFVVGRRSTGGYRLKLDEFTVDSFSRRGFKLVCKEERQLLHKRIPKRINRFARDEVRQSLVSALVPTMSSEIVVVMSKS